MSSSALRHAALQALRTSHLIGLADHLAARIAVLKSAQSNARFRAAHPERRFPDPALVFEVAGHASLESFDQTGARHAALIDGLLAPVPPKGKILEWGCGPGRILSHLANMRPASSLFGCDIDHRSIASARNAAIGACFRTIAPNPPTPYEPANFDAIFGVSVLTHLPETSAIAWTRELARLIAPHGIIVVTTHGPLAAARLGHAERARFDAGEYVSLAGIRPGRRTFASYINEAGGRRLFEPWFSAIERRPASADFGQDIWVLRAPRALDAGPATPHVTIA